MDSSLASSSSISASSSSQPNHPWFSFPFMLLTIKNLLLALITPNENRQEFPHLQNEGSEVALTENAKFRIGPFLTTLVFNPTFVSGMLVWFVAQSSKVLWNFFRRRRWDLRLMFASEGIIPSTHLALCTALPTSVAISHGVSHSLFPVSLGFCLIVMYDAVRLTRHAAEVVNTLPAVEERREEYLVGYALVRLFVVAMVGCMAAIFLIKLYCWILIVSLLFGLIMSFVCTYFFPLVSYVNRGRFWWGRPFSFVGSS